MGKTLVDIGFALIYSIVFFFATTSFILSAVFLKYWNIAFGRFYCLLRITDTVGGPDNERRILCYYLVYGLVPIMIVSICIGFGRMLNIVQDDLLPTSSSIIAVEKCFKYNIILFELIVDLVMAVYNLIYASIITAIYIATCHIYRERLLQSFAMKKDQDELLCIGVYSRIRLLYEESKVLANNSDPYVGPAEMLTAIISLEYISTGLLLLAITINVFIFIRNERIKKQMGRQLE